MIRSPACAPVQALTANAVIPRWRRTGRMGARPSETSSISSMRATAYPSTPASLCASRVFQTLANRGQRNEPGVQPVELSRREHPLELTVDRGDAVANSSGSRDTARRQLDGHPPPVACIGRALEIAAQDERVDQLACG